MFSERPREHAVYGVAQSQTRLKRLSSSREHAAGALLLPFVLVILANYWKMVVLAEKLVLMFNFTKDLSYFHFCDWCNTNTSLVLSNQGPQSGEIFKLQMERGTFSHMPTVRRELKRYM